MTKTKKARRLAGFTENVGSYDDLFDGEIKALKKRLQDVRKGCKLNCFSAFLLTAELTAV